MSALDTAEALAAPPPLATPAGPHAERRAAAVARAVHVAPHLAVLAMAAVPRLPVRVTCSQNIRTLAPTRHTSVLWVDEAVDCPWLAWDCQNVRNVLAVDIDHPDALDRWQDLPPHIRPHLVMDPWSGRAHAVLPLASPVPLTEKGREGPRILADLAGRLLASALGGALLPVRSVVKSPWGLTATLTGQLPRRGPMPLYPELHEATRARGLVWHTVPGAGPCELRAVVAALAPQHWHEPAALPRRPIRPWHKKDRKACPLGRNVVLFDAVRFWAYDREERDGAAIAEEARRVNATFSIPLPPGEVAATARSISKFMATRFRPRHGMNDRVKRGRDASHIEEEMTLAERQAVAARRTAEARTGATLAKLADAAAALSRDGTRPSQTALAAATGLTLRRVKELWNVPALPVSYGALSGNGPRLGAPAGGGGETLSLSHYAESLWVAAQRRAAEAAVIAAYDEQTARMSRRGGRPEPVPPRSPDASPAVAEAHRRALAARRDAERRERQRQERAEAAERAARRRADFVQWALAHDGAAFRAFLSTEGRRWDALEMTVDPDDRAAMRQHHERRGAFFKRLHQEWRAAQEAARRANRLQRFRRPADDIDHRARQLAQETRADEERAREAARARLSMPSPSPFITAPGMPSFLVGRIRLPAR